jgi:energy-coupling factor transporter ATP-binding protein EcfA2
MLSSDHLNIQPFQMSTSPETPSVQKQLEEWLAGQPIWLQFAAKALLSGEEINASKAKDLGQMAINQANGLIEIQPLDISLQALFGNAEAPVSLRSLSSITGIGQLRPRNPLSIGENPITVIYGANGSGKSSYVRILKQACGARHKGELHKDVFRKDHEPQACTIAFSEDGAAASVVWNPEQGVVPILSSVDIFDTHCGHSYLTSEAKARYEPQALQFLSELASICDEISGMFTKAIDRRPRLLPALPNEFAATAVGKWYDSLTFKAKDEELNKWCRWTETEETELEELTKALAERSPEDRAKELRTRKAQAESILLNLSNEQRGLSDDFFQAIQTLRQKVASAQKTAELAAAENLELAQLEGVGTREWAELWTIAKKYSETTAYVGIPFPNTGEESRCVLCHQELGSDAKARLRSFEEFVSDEASKAVTDRKKELEAELKLLPLLPTSEILTTQASAAGMDETATAALLALYELKRSRLARFHAAPTEDCLPTLQDIQPLSDILSANAKKYEEQAKAFLESANPDERAKKKNRQTELRAQQAVSVQNVAIAAEIERLKKVDQLKKAQNLCKTRGISVKKDSLAESLITPAYVEAFNAELVALGARRISVELVKTRVSKGAILHQIRLKDLVHSTPIQEVLSEGEHRIICLAAFLADSKANPNGSTFVFDDPISSLDLDYEEYVVQRLVKLSADRPVIVFTHRLSLLGMVRDYAEKDNVQISSCTLRREPWGAGEPGDEAIESDNPKKALNHHLPQRISDAKTVYETSGTTSYEPFAQSICTEIRKTIERLIEFDLMADVVQRHRRGIKTLGKLDKLASIRPEDCDFIDQMMTKYSRYEHAQSQEAPVSLPEPAELIEDVRSMKEWRDGLDARRK